MKALILNSGLGRRMGGQTRSHPKCMTSIGEGYTLLSRQLLQLQALGIEETIITTGPFADALQAHVRELGLKMPVRYIPNPEYDKTNYIVSLHLAAPLLGDADLLFLHGDLVIENSVLTDLLHSPHSVMAVDSSLPLPEKDFKARLRGGFITEVGVPLFDANCIACQPAYKWLAQDFTVWLDSVAAFVQRGETSVYAENAFNALQGTLLLRPLEMNGRLCAEIDTPEDHAVVSARFVQTLQAEERQVSK